MVSIVLSPSENIIRRRVILKKTTIMTILATAIRTMNDTNSTSSSKISITSMLVSHQTPTSLIPTTTVLETTTSTSPKAATTPTT